MPVYRVAKSTPRAILASLAGVLLTPQVGLGGSTVGNQYTLLAVATSILSGARLIAGSSSFGGCRAGAVTLGVLLVHNERGGTVVGRMRKAVAGCRRIT